MPVPARAFRQRQSPRGAFPGGHAAGAVRPGLLLGRRAQVLDDGRRATARGRLCGRPHAEPDVRGSVHAATPGTTRSCASSTTRGQVIVRGTAAGVLGIARPDAGHAPGQRRRHAVPLGHLRLRRGPARGGRAERCCLWREAYGGGLPRHHDRDHRAARVLLRRGLPPAVPREESRTAIAGSAERASPVRSGCSPRLAEPACPVRFPAGACQGSGLPSDTSLRARPAWPVPASRRELRQAPSLGLASRVSGPR